MYTKQNLNQALLSGFLAGGVDSTPPRSTQGFNTPELIGLRVLARPISCETWAKVLQAQLDPLYVGHGAYLEHTGLCWSNARSLKGGS